MEISNKLPSSYGVGKSPIILNMVASAMASALRGGRIFQPYPSAYLGTFHLPVFHHLLPTASFVVAEQPVVEVPVVPVVAPLSKTDGALLTLSSGRRIVVGLGECPAHPTINTNGKNNKYS